MFSISNDELMDDGLENSRKSKYESPTKITSSKNKIPNTVSISKLYQTQLA